MTKFYNCCTNAASATDKIVIDDTFVTYFGDTESAGTWFNNYAAVKSPSHHTYKWYSRKINWETGCVYKEWVPLEFGSTEYLRAFAKTIGVQL